VGYETAGLEVTSSFSTVSSLRWIGKLAGSALLGWPLRILQFFTVATVGACLAVTRDVFDAVGGFGEIDPFQVSHFLKKASTRGRFRVMTILLTVLCEALTPGPHNMHHERKYVLSPPASR